MAELDSTAAHGVVNHEKDVTEHKPRAKTKPRTSTTAPSSPIRRGFHRMVPESPVAS